jgi:hypothetical protein
MHTIKEQNSYLHTSRKYLTWLGERYCNCNGSSGIPYGGKKTVLLKQCSEKNKITFLYDVNVHPS